MMQKINTFFYSLWRTFTSPKYYADILKAPFSFSLKYFVFYFFLYSIVGTVFFAIKDISPLRKMLATLPSKLSELYPQELEIKLINGKAQTNVKEPYYILLGKIEEVFTKDKVLGDSSAKIKYLLVIDTKGRVDDYYNYQTAALLTEKSIAVGDDKGGYKVYPFENANNVTIDKALVDKSILMLTPFLKYVIPTLLSVFFISFLVFIPIYYLVYLLFLAFLLWVMAKLFKLTIPYSKSYQIGMHFVTITTTLFGLLSLATLKVSFPFLQTLVLLLWGAVVLSVIKKSRLQGEALRS